MEATEWDQKALFEKISPWLGVTCTSLEQLKGGGNNILYRAELDRQAPVLIKQYHRDERHRLAREFHTLQTLHRHGVTDVPRPIKMIELGDIELGAYEFVDGRMIPAEELTHKQAVLIGAFIARMHTITPEQVTETPPMAFMSFGSMAEYIQRIRERMGWFLGPNGAETLDERVRDFMEDTGVIAIVNTRLKRFEDRVGARLNLEIRHEDLRLSPVDFGAHNMLWRPDGSLCVIDFEYGGWDHPLHVLADTLAHDRMRTLPESHKQALVNAYLRRTTVRDEVTNQLTAYCHLAEINWLMILVTSMMRKRIAQQQRIHEVNDEAFDVNAYLNTQMQKITDRLCELE